MVSHLTHWTDPPPQITLLKNQVHLWRFRLDLSATDVAGLKRLLSDDELARAERLLDPVKEHRFVAARGQMRQVLSRYLDCPPEEISFTYGAHGKPRLADVAAGKLCFNLSHACDWGLLAVAQGFDVGVDIEKIDDNLDYEKVAARFFTDEEAIELGRYHATRRRRGFYRIWTRKEAGLKGPGGGFSTSAAIRADRKGLVRSFTVDRGYLGAFTASGRVATIYRWDFS